MNITEIRSRLSNVERNCTGWKARCPAHEDQNPSLSIKEGADGRVLLHCFANCTCEAICAALGIKQSDLMPSNNGHTNGGRKIVKTYDYTDETGGLLFQKVRLDPKDFRIRRPDGKGDWEYKLADVRRVLYRLPQLLIAGPDQPIFIVEGEKDADRLAALGFVATTNFDGAGKWLPEYTEFFRGRNVIIIPDNDAPGMKHAEKVAESLRDVARRIQITTLPGVGDHGDVSDWLEHIPSDWGNIDEEDLSDISKKVLQQLKEEDRQYRASRIERLIARRRRRMPAAGRLIAAQDSSIVPLADLVRQHPALRPPVIEGLLRQGETLNIIAPPKVGKSWLAHSLAFCVANGRSWLGRFTTTPGRVLLIDNELHRETLAHRLQKVADAMELPLGSLDVWSMRGQQNDYFGITSTIDKLAFGIYSLVIVDAHYRMTTATSENDNIETMRVYNLLDRYAAQTGAAWVLIHHASKGDQSGKDVTDVGAGAGSQSRATDTHLILRKHENEDCYVLEAVTRSFSTPEPAVLRWQYPLWIPEVDMSPKLLQTAATKRKKREDDGRRETILNELRHGERTANTLSTAVGMGRLKCLEILEMLVNEDLVKAKQMEIRGNETMVYCLSETPT